MQQTIFPNKRPGNFLNINNTGKYAVGLLFNGAYTTKTELLEAIEAHKEFTVAIKGSKLTAKEKEEIVLDFCKRLHADCDATKKQLFQMKKTQQVSSTPFFRNTARRQLAEKCQNLTFSTSPKALDEAVKLVIGEMNSRAEDVRKMLGTFDLVERGLLNVTFARVVDVTVVSPTGLDKTNGASVLTNRRPTLREKLQNIGSTKMLGTEAAKQPSGSVSNRTTN